MSMRTLVVVATLLSAAPAFAQGEIVLTQAAALKGSITPGDFPGFPILLSKEGSYVLGSNLLPPAGKDGILIKAHEIDIDMNGFVLNGGDVAANGVSSDDFHGGRIHDGVIKWFKLNGLLLDRSTVWTIENMRVIANGKDGVHALESHFLRIVDNVIISNVGAGIYCGSSCHVVGNIVSNNSGLGIYVRSGTVLENTIFNNEGGSGIDAQNSNRTGFGDNTVVDNNLGEKQVIDGALPLNPNACVPAPC